MRRSTKWLIGAGVSFFLVVVISAGLLLRWDAARAYDSSLVGRLSVLATAIREYVKEHGALPPHAIYDPSRKPLLSWRVVLLPTLGEEKLYKQFRLNEPWDSPHNIKLLPKIPSLYSLIEPKPEDPKFSTRFKVIVGPGTAFEGIDGKNPHDFPHGGGFLFVVVEAPEPVPWTKPEDLSFHPERPTPALGSPDSHGIGVTTGNGNFCLFPRDEMSDRLLRAFITGEAGEESPGQ